MTQIHVLVAATSKDLMAEFIAAAVVRSAAMVLLGSRVVAVADIGKVLAKQRPFAACALVLVGPALGTQAIATRCLRRRKRLVVAQVDIASDVVQITARDVGMDSLLAALRNLLDRTSPLMALFDGNEELSAHRVEAAWPHMEPMRLMKSIAAANWRVPCRNGARERVLNATCKAHWRALGMRY